MKRYESELRTVREIGCGQRPDRYFGEGFMNDDIFAATRANDAFRRVIRTEAGHGQMTLMHLRPGENIGRETHRSLMQWIVVVEGKGEASVSRALYQLGPGALVVVPHGAEHDVWASEDGPGLRLFSIYSKPEHPRHAVQESKE